MQEAKVVPAPPRGRRGVTEESLSWDPLVHQAKEVYPNSLLVAEAVEDRIGKKLRRKTRWPYYTDEGHIKVSVLNSSIGTDGIRRGDVYFTWVPYEKKKKKGK